MAKVNLSRLKAQLMVSDLRIRDNPTFQVINQLIGLVEQLQNNIIGSIDNITPSPIPVVPIVLQSNNAALMMLGSDLGNYDNSFDQSYIPGPRGIPGITGVNGINGINGSIGIPGIDGIDGIDVIEGESILSSIINNNNLTPSIKPWTPIDSSGASLTFTSVTSDCVRIGPLVWVSFALTYPSTISGLEVLIGGLPFMVGAVRSAGCVGQTDFTTGLSLFVIENTTTFRIRKLGDVQVFNSDLSLKYLRGTIVYRASVL